MNDFNQQVIEEFRANNGRVGGPFADRDNMVVIHTTGARTGRTIVNPLVYLPDGDRIVLIASNGGADKHPAWYHNLVADPKITIELGTETYTGRAELVHGQERADLYDRMVALIPGFADYREKTTREIPVFAVYRD